MSATVKIVIIGAGIGGLTTALFLEKLGINYEILEQSPDIKPIGAGLILAHNAMQVYDKLGIKQAITAVGKPIFRSQISTAHLKQITKIDNQYFDAKYSVNSIAIHRATLQNLLMTQLKKKSIQHHKQVVDIRQGMNTVIVFSDQSEMSCDAVIAADGIHSIIRNTLFTDSCIRNTNQVCWRGISTLRFPHAFKGELHELWGDDSRFGFVEIAHNKVYWYAIQRHHKSTEQIPLTEDFRHYHPIVSELIAKTPPDKIIRNDISDLMPMDSWLHKRVCLLGDAAHATTPNLGQGACQAIEDAYVLSHLLKQHSVDQAFARYEILRKPKADMVVKLSRQFGQLSSSRSPLLSIFRNMVMRTVPAQFHSRKMEQIYQLCKF